MLPWSRESSPASARAPDRVIPPHDAVRTRPLARPGPGAHEYREPPLQPGAHRFHPHGTGSPRREVPADLRRKQDQGQSVRHPGRGQARGHHPLGPHRHRALGRPGLEHGPALGHGARRPAPRPGQRRHEGLHRHRAVAGAPVPGKRRALRHPLCLQLRRGSRLLRRARTHRRHARGRRAAAGLHRGRTHRHGAGHRAQGGCTATAAACAARKRTPRSRRIR